MQADSPPQAGFKPQVVYKFSTPILTHQLPQAAEINARLKPLILAREKASSVEGKPHRQRSNVSGWRLEEDLWQWPDPVVKELQAQLIQAVASLLEQAASSPLKVKSMKLSTFLNVNRNGSYNTMHCHPHQHWAAVYYVDIGQADPDKPESGLIEFQDPRAVAAFGQFPGFDFGLKFCIKPQPGLLLIFPAWLNHFVHPFFGAGERISIAFNIKLLF